MFGVQVYYEKEGVRVFLDHGVKNAKLKGSIPIPAIRLRAGLNDPCRSLPTWNIL